MCQSPLSVLTQLGTSLQLRLEGSEEEEEEEEEEENGDSDSLLEPGQPVVQWQEHSDASEAMLERLEGLEADVRFLCTELGAEKLLWSSRFLEVLREQQSLRQRDTSGQSPCGHHAAPSSLMAENVSEGVSRASASHEGATRPSLPRLLRTQARVVESQLRPWMCLSIRRGQPGLAPSCRTAAIPWEQEPAKRQVRVSCWP
ncbi:uncharacterized protein LOC126645760 isoform X1 [Myiozetetes cayanensis]|uniref:uncharacterized protein LOC126645760 isoform X1 n=1 Tax=Myiozetetes cayanensis TaxID=478635 RepID=UPI00215ED659|nr:uncharacterized protein LOC126645760 isoform X1 [Myiozetetes cayanensis]